jgi:hypothetical protein
MEAGELNNRLCDLLFESVLLLGVGGKSQSAVYHNLAAFGDGLEHPVTQAVGAYRQLQAIKTVTELNLQ